MSFPNIRSAQALRDGGIDAMAALDSALAIALDNAPMSVHREMKIAIGRAMSAIMDETTRPAISAYPELELSDEKWQAVARERANARAALFPPDTLPFH